MSKFLMVKELVSARFEDFVISEDHYGNSHFGPLKTVYVRSGPITYDATEYNKLGYGLVFVDKTLEDFYSHVCDKCGDYFKNEEDLEPFKTSARAKDIFCCERCINEMKSNGFGPGNHE